MLIYEMVAGYPPFYQVGCKGCVAGRQRMAGPAQYVSASSSC